MVGHSGIMPAAIKAVQTIDSCLARIVPAFLQRGGTVAITADHGNVEMMIDPVTGEPHTAHTTNPVPLVLTIDGGALRGEGELSDLAPTVLALLGLDRPPAMTGSSLVAPENR